MDPRRRQRIVSSEEFLFPSDDRDPRAFSHTRFHFKLIDQSLSATQAKTQAGAGREAVAQRKINVRDARSLILEDQPNADSRTVKSGKFHLPPRP